MRLLPVDDKCSLRGETLKKAIEEDLEKGLIPCYVVATLGTTGTCAFDNLDEIGLICKKYNVWLHVDAAYAGWRCIMRVNFIASDVFYFLFPFVHSLIYYARAKIFLNTKTTARIAYRIVNILSIFSYASYYLQLRYTNYSRSTCYHARAYFTHLVYFHMNFFTT